jgi:two-component system response regulator AtoC
MPVAGLDLSKFPILVVDDEPDNLDAFRFNYGKVFPLRLANSAEEALELARAEDIAVVVTDQRMPKMTGLDLLKALRDVRPDAVGIIVTAFTDVEVLIESINLGRIYRYVTKPWDSKELKGIIVQAIERFHLLRENRRLMGQLEQYAGVLSREAHSEFNFGAIVGDSPALREVLAKVEQVAQTAATVLLRGDTGTGKEMVARAIHINSPRESRPFVRVNCAALAPGVLESELFGHEKGAFTGAMARRAGRFELADGGTLFLDEVGDVPADVQVKLLRVLQEREFERVGGVETVKVDVRVISATHRDLEALINEGKFREDLYYRLNVFPITLPPLRDRPGDIPVLVEHFIQKFSQSTGKAVRGADAAALSELAAYPWPGNVRELENVIERALILARGFTLSSADLDFGRRLGAGGGVGGMPNAVASIGSGGVVNAGGGGAGGAVGEGGRSFYKRISEQEKNEIVSAVERAQGNIAHAARSLGINRSTLYYRMRKHNLEHLLPTKDEPPAPGAGAGGDPGAGAPA